MKYAYDRELVPHIGRLPSTDLSDLAATRAARAAQFAALSRVDATGVHVRDLTIPSMDGGAPVKVRLYRPESAGGSLPALCLMHAGGWVLGSVDELHPRAAQLCRDLNAVIVSVDYRLAPECRYPAALDDSYSALAWLAARAADLDVDSERIAVHGISSGANLAAAIALLARDRGGPPICFQCLCYPPLDDRMQSWSARTFTDTAGITASFLVECWDLYLGAGMRGTDVVSKYAAPAREADLSALPPTYISALQYDPLRDEGIAYATALLRAGAEVEMHVFPGTFHGSQKLAHAAVSQRELAEVVTVLRRAFSLEATLIPPAASRQ
jgi:acetyl esterase/lipase